MTRTTPSANRLLAEFVASARPPADARRVARDAFQDTLGVILAGAPEESARLVRALVAAESSDGHGRIIGTRQRASASGAALANGTAAHALDFDDVSFVSLGHPSAPLVAATLAAAEMTGANGRTLLDGYCVGFEIEMMLGRAMNPSHYRRGWHATSTIGTLGAAAAVARVLGLDTDTTARALAISASLACGLKGNFGTMSKPLHAGLAARNGVEAALLAASGFTASDAALDGPQGFAIAFDGEQTDLGSIAPPVGDRWAIADVPPSVKLYPSCAATHPSMDAIVDLKHRVGFGADDVTSIDLGVDALTPNLLQYDRPQTGLEAKFSLHYCAAVAVIDDVIDLETFEDARVRRPEVQAFLSRVTMRVDPAVEAAGSRLTHTAMTVRLGDGREFRESSAGARGQPGRPVAASDLELKFRRCARRVLAPAQVDRALEALIHLESQSELSAFTGLLIPAADRAGAGHAG